MIGASALFTGQVMHQRLRPRRHRLNYRIYMLLLDLDEIENCDSRLRLFSRNRRNLFAFYDGDHGNKSGTPLRAQIEQHLADVGTPVVGGAIRLLTMPRVLGFAFNPISVFFCYQPGGEMAAILYEVNNTFGQRHTYLLPVGTNPGRVIRQAVAKNLHVSPFMGMDMDYAFRVLPPADALAIGITGSDGDGALITAVLTARRQPLSDAALLRAFFGMPLLTFKVVGGILWEALKLWLKRIPVWHVPPAPASPITNSTSAARRQNAP